MISCDEAALFIYPFLDREISADEARLLEEHLAACKDCHGHFEFDKALKQVLKSKILQNRLSPEAWQNIQKKLSGGNCS